MIHSAITACDLINLLTCALYLVHVLILATGIYS